LWISLRFRPLAPALVSRSRITTPGVYWNMSANSTKARRIWTPMAWQPMECLHCAQESLTFSMWKRTDTPCSRYRVIQTCKCSKSLGTIRTSSDRSKLSRPAHSWLVRVSQPRKGSRLPCKQTRCTSKTRKPSTQSLGVSVAPAAVFSRTIN
jgi:hypothetical protein